MLRKDHSPDLSQTTEGPGSNNKNNININLGGPTLLLLLACGVMLGLDISERSSQERLATAERLSQEHHATAEALATQRAIERQTADLSRAWVVNTEQLQRDWFLNTSQLQRSWESQTAIQKTAMENMQRQSRMTELKLDDTTVVLHRAGLQLPGDYTRGPQGNLDTEAFNGPTLLPSVPFMLPPDSDVDYVVVPSEKPNNSFPAHSDH